MQPTQSIIMYDTKGKRLGEVPFEDRVELRNLSSECCYIQFAFRDEDTGRELAEINETTLYFLGRRAAPSRPEPQSREVLIDGVKYVPMRASVIERRDLIRSLVEVRRGSHPDKSDDWFEDESKTLYIEVTDSPPMQRLTVSEFVEALATR